MTPGHPFDAVLSQPFFMPRFHALCNRTDRRIYVPFGTMAMSSGISEQRARPVPDKPGRGKIVLNLRSVCLTGELRFPVSAGPHLLPVFRHILSNRDSFIRCFHQDIKRNAIPEKDVSACQHADSPEIVRPVYWRCFTVSLCMLPQCRVPDQWCKAYRLQSCIPL